jgi:hypothetical protein
MLDTLLSRPDPAGDVRVALLTGMAGVGKTALVVRAGAAAVAAFPDGQLYVDLGGTEPVPASPFDVLGGFLRALGVNARSTPMDLAGRTAEFRSRTAGRRILIMLDNAAGEDQVEPLLCAEPTCATVITSRVSLSGLETPTRIRCCRYLTATRARCWPPRSGKTGWPSPTPRRSPRCCERVAVYRSRCASPPPGWPAAR